MKYEQFFWIGNIETDVTDFLSYLEEKGDDILYSDFIKGKFAFAGLKPEGVKEFEDYIIRIFSDGSDAAWFSRGMLVSIFEYKGYEESESQLREYVGCLDPGVRARVGKALLSYMTELIETEPYHYIEETRKIWLEEIEDKA